jgi:hypothetical protein
MGAEIVLSLIVLFLILPRLIVLAEKIIIAFNDANSFQPITCPQRLFVDQKTNTWQVKPVHNRTIWWRVFFNSLYGKPL